MIKVKNLVKKYKRLEVLNIPELIIHDNEKIGIMGLNGSGKTTFGEIMVGTKNKSSGEIIYNDKLLRKNAVFQESSYDSEMPIIKIAEFYQGIFKNNENLKDLFLKFDIIDCKNMRYRKLSGGQKQKFKFLIALLNKPNLLLLDELTTSLDYLWRQKIIEIMKAEINNNHATVLLISHDINEISQICNRVIVFEAGKITNDIALGNKPVTNLQILQNIIDLQSQLAKK